MSFNDTSVMFIINNLATNHRHLATAKLYRIYTVRIVLFDKFMTLLECKSLDKESHSIGDLVTKSRIYAERAYSDGLQFEEIFETCFIRRFFYSLLNVEDSLCTLKIACHSSISSLNQLSTYPFSKLLKLELLRN